MSFQFVLTNSTPPLTCGMSQARCITVATFGRQRCSGSLVCLTRMAKKQCLALDIAFRNFDNVILLGDLNFDMLSKEKSSPLTELCDIFDLKNLVREATCFTKNNDPSLVDVILTNRPRSFYGTLVCDTGLSDVHRLVASFMKNKLKPKQKVPKVYHCFENTDEKRLQNDIASAPLHVAEIFDDIDDVCWAQERLLTEIIDEHIPIKKRKPRAVETPFMNGPLRKETNQKKKRRRKFDNSKTDRNWRNFRTQRNKISAKILKIIQTKVFERAMVDQLNDYF